MEKQSEPRNHSQTHKLVWRWLTNSEAFYAARRSAVEMEAMRVGVGLLSVEQYEQGLLNSDFEVLLLPHACAALISWGECENGKVLNILTTTGNLKYAELGLACIERAGLQRGATVVMSVGHLGWYKFAKAHGYTVKKVMLMRKNIHAHSLS